MLTRNLWTCVIFVKVDRYLEPETPQAATWQGIDPSWVPIVQYFVRAFARWEKKAGKSLMQTQ